MQAALSAILTSLAKHYVQLSPSDVGIGISGGRLVVSDVQLRPESFESPALPFRIVSGRAGKLRVNIPWGALSSSPVSVYLENVNLVAEPRSTSSKELQTKVSLPPELPEPQKWHQTRVGRVLFNTKAEIKNLRVEYRDSNCIACIEAKFLCAHSVNKCWKPEFVSLDCEEGSVVMRKLFTIGRLRCTMIPAGEIDENFFEPCFEHSEPMLDGVDASVKALVCAGDVKKGGSNIEGVHTELDFELHEPTINFSLRQGDWIQGILKRASGLCADKNEEENSMLKNEKKIQRETEDTELISKNFDTAKLKKVLDSETNEEASNIGIEKTSSSCTAKSKQTFAGSHKESESESSEDLLNGNYRNDAVSEPSTSFSFWSALVEENSDETVDDAAYALGLKSVIDERDYEIESTIEKKQKSTPTTQSSTDESEKGTQYALNAVKLAAMAGGMTFRVHLRTSGHESKSEGTIIKGDDLKLFEAIESAKAARLLTTNLKKKNESLSSELRELEIMASEAVQSKDNIIRDIQEKLRKAEKKIEFLTSNETENESEEQPEVSIDRMNRTETMIIHHDHENNSRTIENQVVEDVSLETGSTIIESVPDEKNLNIMTKNNKSETESLIPDFELVPVEIESDENFGKGISFGGSRKISGSGNKVPYSPTVNNRTTERSYEEEGLTLI